MTLIPVKTPKTVKMMFPNYVWDVKTTEKVIHLTFDDGPTPEITNWTLTTLREYNAKATFFCIGNNIKRYPKIFQDILNEGHTIGNHTLNHLNGWKASTKTYLEEVTETQKIIEYETSKNNNYKYNNTQLFRPPFGKIKAKQAKYLIHSDHKIIMWDVLSFDWKQNISPENCLNKIISKTSNGSIIVFHDSVKSSKNMKYALPKVLEHFSKKGYRFDTLPF